MVRLNPGAFFPEDSFAQLKIEDLIQLLGPTDLRSMKEEFMEAVRTNRVETIPVSDLVLALLLNDQNSAACDVTQSLYSVLDSQSSGMARYQWQNTLTEVIPYAVVMGKWDYLDQFIARSMVDAAVACELLTLAAHVCLAKELYQQAGQYLQAAKVLAAEDPRISTGAIEDLMQFAEARHGGDEEVALTDFDNIYKPTLAASCTDDTIADQENELDEICTRLRRWQLQLGANESDEPWRKPEDLAFFFQRFRPDGGNLELFCEEIGCPSIAPRVLDVFRATAANYKDEGTIDAYFVVREPQPASDFELLSLASSYFSSLTHVAVASDPAIEMEAYFNAPPTIAIKRGCEAPLEASDFQVGVNEALHAYFQQFPLDNCGAGLLKEALYTMACDYSLMHYVLWPIVQARFEHDHVDPYSTYFELWKRGVDLRFDGAGGAVLYVTAAA
jgi:hypothetical protein